MVPATPFPLSCSSTARKAADPRMMNAASNAATRTRRGGKPGAELPVAPPVEVPAIIAPPSVLRGRGGSHRADLLDCDIYRPGAGLFKAQGQREGLTRLQRLRQP